MSDYYFELLNWNESSYWQDDYGRKMTKVSVSKSYHGPMQGVGQLEYLMSYQADGCAYFVGMERFSGMLQQKKGGFVLQHRGNFVGGKAHSQFYIVPGSGLGELIGIQAKGSFVATHGQNVQFEFDYQLSD